MISMMLLCGALAFADAAGEQSESLAAFKTYNDLKAKTARTPEAQVKLALWCEAHGLSAERTKHLMLATLLDPANAAARGLLGLVSFQGKWQAPDEVARQVQDDPARKALIQEYLQRRARRGQSRRPVEAGAVVRGERPEGAGDGASVPGAQARSAARGGLEAAGLQEGGRPLGQAGGPRRRTAELEAQNRANKFWKPRLEHWRNGLSARDEAKRAEAEQALGQITDPRAVPMVWSVFARGDEAKQQVAVKVLGQIDAPGSSRALACWACSVPRRPSGQACTEILRRRDPREFAGTAGRHDSRPGQVQGQPRGRPGLAGGPDRGGQDADTQRRYSPPRRPVYMPAFNDTVFPDAYGQPVVYHPLGYYSLMEGQALIQSAAGPGRLRRPAPIPSWPDQPGAGRTSTGAGDRRQPCTARSPRAWPQPRLRRPLAPTAGGSPRLRDGHPAIPYAQIPIGQMMAAAEATAYLAQQQLAADVRSIEELNATIAQSNSRALDDAR